MHCALSPSEPPDGERPRCFRLAVVGGAQLRGGWHLSAIARLQGFSLGSPAASPHQWSRRRVTTGSMVGRSKPGCGLCPTLSFKDLHHPCWGGGELSRSSTSRTGRRKVMSEVSVSRRRRSPSARLALPLTCTPSFSGYHYQSSRKARKMFWQKDFF
jgi:hypothetical protein